MLQYVSFRLTLRLLPETSLPYTRRTIMKHLMVCNIQIFHTTRCFIIVCLHALVLTRVCVLYLYHLATSSPLFSYFSILIYPSKTTVRCDTEFCLCRLNVRLNTAATSKCSFRAGSDYHRDRLRRFKYPPYPL